MLFFWTLHLLICTSISVSPSSSLMLLFSWGKTVWFSMWSLLLNLKNYYDLLCKGSNNWETVDSVIEGRSYITWIGLSGDFYGDLSTNLIGLSPTVSDCFLSGVYPCYYSGSLIKSDIFIQSIFWKLIIY